MPSDKIYLFPNDHLFHRFIDARLKTVGLSFDDLAPFWVPALEKTRSRFATIRNKYYASDAPGLPLRAGHIGHSTLLLYELSRQAWEQGEKHVADILYFLNVSGGGCNMLYEIEVPLKTFCDHPCGAVIGRGTFSERSSLSFSTNCTIGNSRNIYPVIDGNLTMLPNSSILGTTTISGNVVLSNGSKLLNAGEIKDVVVYGSPPANTFRPIDSAAYDGFSNFRP
jgi:serine O-acetyltransferase